METVRQVNVKLLREKLQGAKSIRGLAKQLDVSDGLLRWLAKGSYAYEVRPENRAKLCDGLGLGEDELFPIKTAS